MDPRLTCKTQNHKAPKRQRREKNLDDVGYRDGFLDTTPKV